MQKGEQLFICIGKTGRPHGLGGELKFHVDERYLEDFLEAEVVFLETKGQKLPYFIEAIREGNDVLVKLEDTDSPEQARILAGLPVFLREADLLQEEEREGSAEWQFERFVGYSVVDTFSGQRAKIVEIVAMPQQYLAYAEREEEGREVLIPMHPGLIKKVDEASREILMELPEGLFDL